MKNTTRKALLRVLLAAVIAVSPLGITDASETNSPGPQTMTSLTKGSPNAENYDIRDDESGPAREVIGRYRDKVSKERKEKIGQKKEKIHGAIARLEREIPGLEVVLSNHTGGPEIVGTNKGRQKLTGRSSDKRENVARGFLHKNPDLYGLHPSEVAQLKKTTDYENPAGNLGWVEFKQEVAGLPVFRGELRVAVNRDGELIRTTGNLVPALEDFGSGGGKTGITPTVPAAEAVSIGAASIGVNLPGGSLTLKSVNEDQTVYVFSGGPFDEDVKVQLEYFPLDTGVMTLAWSMILWQENAAYYIYVSAEGGEFLWRKNIVNEQSVPATYVIYNAPSPAPLAPSASPFPGTGLQGAAIPRASIAVVSEHSSNNNGWMNDAASVTTGNNVDAGLDLTAPNGIDAGTRPTGTAFRVFDYSYNPGPGIPPPGDSPTLAGYRNGEVTDMFFWSNRYHDRLYALGFTEAARNFQLDNFGRGGLGNDYVRAEGQDSSGTNNANFATPPDGSLPRMQMFIFTGPTPDRTSALDHHVLLHELTHGTSNRLHANASGLGATMSGGMGEGWSDFYGIALTDDPSSDGKGIYGAGGWVTLNIVAGFDANYYYGIRRFPHAVMSNVGPNGKPHNPLTFADIDPTQISLTDGAFPRGPIGSATSFQVHNIGEIWCIALMEMRARLITRLGFAVGNQLALQLVTDGMKLDPVNPTLLQGRNAILAANFATGDAATEFDIWKGFATRGMGFSASAVSSSSSSVVEAFDLPFAIGNVTVVGDSCDSAGTVDPGETVTLSVPVTNGFQLNSVNDITVSLAGGATVAYGSLAPGVTATNTFTFSVPSSATCGSKLILTFTISSNLGSSAKTVELQVGTPTGVLPAGTFSSGDVAVPVLDFTTSEVPINVTGSGIVGDVNVSLRLNHTFDGDLTISLVSPDGKVVALSNGRGSSGDNFGTGTNNCSGTPTVFDDSAGTAVSAGVAPFTGSFRPDTPLSGFNGRQMNGIWKLRVTDGFGIDEGVIGCVTLELKQQLYYCCGVAGTPLIQASGSPTLVNECTSAQNNGPDPGEVVTMSFPMRNVGSGLTTNLIATLQNSGGITPISGPQSYGVLSPIGPAVSRDFTFAISSSIACGSNAVATFALEDAGVSLGMVSFNIRTGAVIANTFTFSNPANISIPSVGAAGLYPSPIVVSGVTGTVVGVNVTLSGLTHTWPDDIDVLLVGPGGQKFVPMSDAGGSNDVSNITLTLSDSGAALLSDSGLLTSGTFKPTNYGTDASLPAPAPPIPYLSPATAGSATFASAFGATANGTWNLWVRDQFAGDLGQFAGGWSISFNTDDSSCAVVNTPTITGESVDKPALWPPNHKMEDVFVTYTVSDCAHCTLSVASNEPINGTGDGDTSPDWEVLGPHTLRLRAERAGTGTGRIYTITITCFNGTGTTVRTVPVYVAHNIGSPSAGSSFRINTLVDFAGTFWDVAGRLHTARWLFDALSVNGIVVEPSGSRLGTVRGSYVFPEPGVYKVTMNVTDDRGTTASINNAGDMEAIVVIYDPNGGYVIGGGWFDSPAGAYRANPALTGKVGYGFSSQYKNGSNPKGEAQMIFNAGNLRFEATSFDYLSISGARAQFAGSGKLNGQGANHDFILTIIDGGAQGGGGVDRIRLKIWQKGGALIYDSQLGASDASDPTTAVGAGSSVVIQK